MARITKDICGLLGMEGKGKRKNDPKKNALKHEIDVCVESLVNLCRKSLKD